MNDDENEKRTTLKLPAVQPHQVELMRGQQASLGKRVTGVETRVGDVESAIGVAPRPFVPRPDPPPAADVAKHRAAAIEATRQKSDAEHGFASTVGGMIAHTKRLEEAVEQLARTQRENDAAQDHALVVITRELGIESKLPPKLQKSLPPAAESSPPLPPVLGRLERRAKRSQIVQFVIALGVLAEVIRGLIASLAN